MDWIEVPVVKQRQRQSCRSEPEGDQIRERIELGPERRTSAGGPSHLAVEHIEQHARQDEPGSLM
jgi:hypothetical protein